MRGFKSIFVSSKHKINCFLIQEKYFQTANAVDTLPLKYHVSTIYYMEWPTILSHFLYIHAKKPASLYVGNIIFIFIETITTNFNIFYGIIANQGANTMITPKTTIICQMSAPSADIWPLGDTSATLRIPRELRHKSIGIGAVLSTRGKFTKNWLFEN